MLSNSTVITSVKCQGGNIWLFSDRNIKQKGCNLKSENLLSTHSVSVGFILSLADSQREVFAAT